MQDMHYLCGDLKLSADDLWKKVWSQIRPGKTSDRPVSKPFDYLMVFLNDFFFLNNNLTRQLKDIPYVQRMGEGKDQEIIQSNTTPDPGHHMGK